MSVALAEMLSCNKSLTELNLEGCAIPEAGLREIARGLLKNTTLQTLKLDPSEQKKHSLKQRLRNSKEVETSHFRTQADLSSRQSDGGGSIYLNHITCKMT